MAERRATHAEVADVVRRFTASSSAKVDVALDADLDELPPEVVATVHRVVVESLTNVRRHAPTATLVRIAVTRIAAAVTVTVFNTGGRATRRRRPPGSPRGTGLASLNESVEALGGTLLAGPDAGPNAGFGWTVRVEVPA
jgi:signal transduction histidine kinase